MADRNKIEDTTYNKKEETKSNIEFEREIPIPPQPKNNLNEEQKKKKEELKSLIDEEFLRIGKLQKKISNLYLIMSMVIFVDIIIGIVLIFSRVHILFIVLYFVISLPITFGSFITLIIRLYLDKKRIWNKIISILPIEYIKAHFFKANRRVTTINLKVVSDYFKLDNGEYFLNEKTIWIDDDNIANAYYFDKIPNPIEFNFRANIMKYLKYLDEVIKGNSPEKPKSEGIEIEVGYNSENVKLLRNDNFINQLHGSNPMKLRDIVTIILLIVLILIGIANGVLSFVSLSKTPPPQETAKTSFLFIMIFIKRFKNAL